MNPPKEFFLPFLKKEQVAKGIYSFYFDRRKTDFNFLPGQYIRMVLPHASVDERGTSRFFTIASSPLEKNLMITTKVVKSSFKHTLFHLIPETQVRFYGPMGNFFLDDKEQQPLVLLAAGMGITPFHSMLTYAAQKKVVRPITLLVSFTSDEEMIFYDELSKIAKAHRNIKIIYTTNRISKELIKKHIHDVHKPKYYIVGPPAMSDAMKIIVTSLGVDEEQIVSENFTGY